MTNLLFILAFSFQLSASPRCACVSFVAEPGVHYRLERTLVLPATNWLAAASLEAQPYHMPAVLCDAGSWPAAFYRVTALGGRPL